MTKIYKKNSSNIKYNVVELFAGAGGLALGLEKAGFVTTVRQMDKSNSNNIGYFQQNIFKYIHQKDTKVTKWHVPKKGFDIVNEVDEIYVEMKNKHNTMNSSSSQKTYTRMQNKILNNRIRISCKP